VEHSCFHALHFLDRATPRKFRYVASLRVPPGFGGEALFEGGNERAFWIARKPGVSPAGNALELGYRFCQFKAFKPRSAGGYS
jgi:hypothetical protein